MDNIKVLEFENALDKFIGEYDLPSEVKRLVLKELYDKVCLLSKNESLLQLQTREAKPNESGV